jgi:hypothetical protein
MTSVQSTKEATMVGGCKLLSRMNYRSTSITTSKQLVSMVSDHNSLGFPLLELPKDPLRVVFAYLDMLSLSILGRVNKELLIKSYSNELWKYLSHYTFDEKDILNTSKNWRMEYKYLKAKRKRVQNYPKYQMMGLLGRMKKIERDTECRPGHAFDDCDAMAVYFDKECAMNDNSSEDITSISIRRILLHT